MIFQDLTRSAFRFVHYEYTPRGCKQLEKAIHKTIEAVFFFGWKRIIVDGSINFNLNTRYSSRSPLRGTGSFFHWVSKLRADERHC